MTEFHVEVVRIGPVSKHPNADRLELTTIHADANGNGGYPVIFGKGDFKTGDLAVYVPVDAVVPDEPRWSFLWEGAINPPPRKRRIRAKKLRGIFSMGILTTVPSISGTLTPAVGTDVAEMMNITKYEDPAEADAVPQTPKRGQQKKLSWFARTWRRALRWLGFRVPNTSSQALYGCPSPELNHLPGLYDLEPYRRYASWFNPGEEVVVTEKIHGQNARFVVDSKGKFHLKSRSVWRENKPEQADNAWAKVARAYGLEEKLAQHPGIILYGETYGNFADLPYGASKEAPGFVAFDVYDSNEGRWFTYDECEDFCLNLGIPTVPVLYQGPIEGVTPKLAEGKTTLNFAKHLREGFVVKPISGRNLVGGQRIVLKMHGEGFLTRKDSDKPFDAGKAAA